MRAGRFDIQGECDRRQRRTLRRGTGAEGHPAAATAALAAAEVCTTHDHFATLRRVESSRARPSTRNARVRIQEHAPVSDTPHESHRSSRDRPSTPGRASRDDPDLDTSLAHLTTAVVDSGEPRQLQLQIATLAAQVIPGADGAEVTVLRPDHGDEVETAVATHPFVTEITRIQYSTVREGPCLTAALELRTVRSAPRPTKHWPGYGRSVSRNTPSSPRWPGPFSTRRFAGPAHDTTRHDRRWSVQIIQLPGQTGDVRSAPRVIARTSSSASSCSRVILPSRTWPRSSTTCLIVFWSCSDCFAMEAASS